MKRIVFPLYPGITHLDFTGPHQVLSRAPDAKVVVASKGGQDIEAEGCGSPGWPTWRRSRPATCFACPADSGPPTPCWTRTSRRRSGG